jgi:hypothetical protein
MSRTERIHFAVFVASAAAILGAFYLVAGVVFGHGPAKAEARPPAAAPPARVQELVIAPHLTYRDMSRFVALHLRGETYTHGHGFNCWAVAGADDRWAANICIAGPGPVPSD